jgi:hypothetical protein
MGTVLRDMGGGGPHLTETLRESIEEKIGTWRAPQQGTPVWIQWRAPLRGTPVPGGSARGTGQDPAH